MKKTRFLCIMLSVLILLLLCGCGGEPPTDNSSVPTPSSSTPENKEDPSPDDQADPENKELGETGGKEVSGESLPQTTDLANGIDVSKWQGAINWKQVSNTDIDFAIIRIGYRGEDGKIHKDQNADYNIQQAIANDILVGVYFFSTATSKAEATEEADWTIQNIKGYAISYPVVYDYEGFKSPDSRTHKLTAAERTKCATAFLGKIKAGGYEPCFYASKTDLCDGSFDIKTIETQYMIWVARYTNPAYPDSKFPDYSGKFDMWQYTDSGKVPGVLGNCDMVVSYFTRQKAAPKDSAVTPPKTDAPLTQEDLLYSSVDEQVTAKELVNLRDAATTKSNIVGTLENGQILKRVAVGKNGWSKLLLDGKTVYAISSYLTTDTSKKPISPPDVEAGHTFAPVNDRVTAKEETNLRDKPSTDGSTVVYTLKNGEYVDRTGLGDRGWSRVIYNGQTLYAVTSFLTE